MSSGNDFLQLLHLGPDAVGGLRWRWRRAAAKMARLALSWPSSLLVESIVLGAQLDAADVLDADLPAVGAAAEDDVAELLRRVEPAERGDGELERPAGRAGRLADLAGRHLHVLLADGLGHVAGRQVQRRQPVGVDPDAHAVVVLAELPHVADAVHAGDLVLDLDGGEVAEVELVVAVVRRVDADDQQDVGVALAGGDAGLLDHVGQQRQGEVDAVLHQHLGEIEIDAGLEGDGEGVGAVVVGLRGPCRACLRRR